MGKHKKKVIELLEQILQAVNPDAQLVSEPPAPGQPRPKPKKD